MRLLTTTVFLLITLLAGNEGKSQQASPIWGIAKTTFLVSDFQVARDYYGRFLGFEEAFSYDSKLGKVLSFKVNDRQFLEFIVDKNAKEKKRLVSYSLEVENVEQMRQYLKSKEVNVPGILTDGAGNKFITVEDPSGNNLEFIQFTKEGLHQQTKGKFLSDKRISKRIHHIGIFADTIRDNDPFYAGILKFNPIVRFPDDVKQKAIILYLQIPDCIENIEHYSPNDENVSHPCFLVEDMQETIYILKERKINEILGKPGIGKGKRWILNISNSDNTRVEFTEAHCVK